MTAFSAFAAFLMLVLVAGVVCFAIIGAQDEKRKIASAILWLAFSVASVAALVCAFIVLDTPASVWG